jgi:hypothetical protein
MKPITLADVLHHLRPGAEFTYKDENYETIEWIVLEGTPPTHEEIAAAYVSVAEARLAEFEERQSRRAEILARLGLTEDEAKIILS